VGRKSKSLIVLLLLSGSLVVSGHVEGQPPGGGRRGPGGLNNMQSRLNSLSVEDRQAFRRNAERWMQMSAEERNLMRVREQLRRQRLKQEAETALRDAGLRRYLQERRKMERELGQEVEAKRKQALPALNDRLKKEFQETTSSGASPASSATPKR